MRFLPTLVALLVGAGAIPASAAPVRMVAADESGVTLQLNLPSFELRPAADGRFQVVARGLETYDLPGRPALPYATALLALPSGARAEARVVTSDAEEARTGVRLAIATKPVFRQNSSGVLTPDREAVPAIQDGAWPTSSLEVLTPFSLRRQRLVAVRIVPFRYDESSGRLSIHRTMTVRVDFVGGAATRAAAGAGMDGSWEAVLRAGVLNYEQAKGWRSAPRPATRRGFSDLAAPGRATPAAAAAFEEDNPEVRVKIDSTGVHQLTYATLAANGLPANLPVGQISVHRHEFVEGSTPPYVTIELPIQVDDRNNDGFFNATDRIVLWVQSWAARSRASQAQRQWGDAEVVYVTSKAAGGLVIPSRAGWRNVPGLTPLASYPTKQHWERNLLYFPFPPDTVTDQFHWTDIAFYYFRDDSIRFETNHLDTSRAVTVAARWLGRIDTQHHTTAQYGRGGNFISIADSIEWWGREAMTASRTWPGSTLGEGLVNSFRFWSKRFPGPPDPTSNYIDNIGLDWIEATYWRRFRAIRGYLACNSGDATGEIQIQATGFPTSDIRVYDVTDSLNPRRLDIDPSHISGSTGNFTIEFQDSVAAGAPHHYVVFATARSLPAAAHTPVTRRQLTARSEGDYLLIVPEAFLSTANPLVALRQGQGHAVVLAPFEAVCDEFNGGRKSSHAVKRFVRHAYENWNARFVLLVGDGSEDPQNFTQEAAPDWIPVHKIAGPVAIQFGLEIIPSDPWYACMENCDLSSTTPALQDLFLGRLPANSVEQAQAMIGKVVEYENVSETQTWRRKVMLSADDAYSGATFFGGGGGTTDYCRKPSELVFKSISLTIADLIKNGAGLQQTVVDSFFLGDILGDIACVNPIPTDTCYCRDLTGAQAITHGQVTPVLVNHLNDGRMWWNFQGHANETVLTHEDLFINRNFPDDKDLLMNDLKPFLFSAFSCHANAFARSREGTFGPSLGEELVLLPQRGGVASWASTGYEILPFSGSSHINISWARAMFEDPPHDEFLNDKGARVLLGESIALALLRYVPGVVFNPNEKGLALTYHLLGDPATRLSIGEPQAVVLANQTPVVDGQPVRLHTLGDTLRIEATLVSNVELTQIALDRVDGTGTVTISPNDYSLTPAFPDTAAGGDGGRRYQLSYSTTLRADSYRYVLRTTDRYGVQGSFDVVFQFLTQLRLEDVPVADGDQVPSAGNLSIRVLSPKPLNPQTDFTLFVNDLPQSFTASAVPGDASGREWDLSWTHAPYPTGDYTVRVAVTGGTQRTHRFLVGEGGVKVARLVAFPNPFDDAGTAFSFVLAADTPTDVHIRVYTQSGRMVYEWIERGMSPGYHQVPWNGLDAEGSSLGNGVYLYKLVAASSAGKDEQLGRLVRLRKPRRSITP